MATELASAFVSLVPSFKGGQAAISKELGGAAGGAGKSAGRRFSSGILGAVKGIAGPLAGAFAGLGAAKFLGDTISEAREAAKVGRLTAAVIKSTGGAANVSAGQIGDLAEKMSNKAGVDDELVQSGANVLLTFTKIRNEAGKGNDVFDQATTSALDMSVALGTDMKSASILVGKALNDPIKGISALGRSGVQFTEAQKKQIETMVESGDTMGAQKMILAELTTQFGGAAAAAADPAEKAQVAWGNFKEQIGASVLPAFEGLIGFFTGTALPAVKDLLAGLAGGGDDSTFATVGKTIREVVLFIKDDAIPAVRSFAEWMDRNRKPILIVAGIITAIYLPALIRAGVVAVISGIKQVGAFIATQAAAIASGAAMSLTVVRMVAGWVLMGTQALINAARIALAWLIALGPIALVIAAVIGLVALIVLNWETIWTFTKRIFTNVWNFLKGLWDTVVAFIGRAIGFVKDIFFRFHPVGIIMKNWGPIWGFITGLWDKVLGFVRGIPERIVSALGNVGRMLFDAGKNIIQGLLDGIGSMIRKVQETIGNVAQTVRDFLPFSPAKRGPLSGSGSPFFSGQAIATMLAEGIDSSVPKVTSASSKMAAAAAEILAALRSGKTFFEDFSFRGASANVGRFNGVLADKFYGGGGDFNRGQIADFLSRFAPLAQGGIVRATPGGVAAILGEGRQDEAVIPLDKLASLMGGPSMADEFTATATLDFGAFTREVELVFQRKNRGIAQRVGAGAGRNR